LNKLDGFRNFKWGTPFKTIEEKSEFSNNQVVTDVSKNPITNEIEYLYIGKDIKLAGDLFLAVLIFNKNKELIEGRYASQKQYSKVVSEQIFKEILTDLELKYGLGTEFHDKVNKSVEYTFTGDITEVKLINTHNKYSHVTITYRNLKPIINNNL